MNSPPTEHRDLVLAPGSYAYVQAENNGAIKTHVGPAVVTLSGQDRPVTYDPDTRTFKRVHQDEAVQTNIAAEEGDYIILENPAADHPEEGGARATPQAGLNMGSRVVIPGPTNFALWPGQSAETVDGHHLSSNEFLIVRIYNEEKARKNWDAGTVTVTIKEPVGDVEGDAEDDIGKLEAGSEHPGRGTQDEPESLSAIDPKELKRGQRIIVRGDQVSFYIPPTGVEVIEDEPRPGTTPTEGDDLHVREAVTLERLEYCILVDENGDKRYERGPAVVFPTPTEHFVTVSTTSAPPRDRIRKFRAIELTSRSGLHIKVIHEYTDAGGKEHKAGDELFITGKEQAIYFPRIEHSIIKYGERDQHFAVAIPRGEGRYVMDRDTGVIETVKGPAMLLPDPRTRVVVRRILSDKEVGLWYPGNTEAADYNRDLAETLAEAAEASLESQTLGALADTADTADYGLREGAVSERMYSTRSRRQRKTSSQSSSRAVKGHHGDEFKRGERFTPPRTVTLDTKYEGVAAISPYVGYAVLIVNKEGKREVHQGPKTILLDYDESLEVLSISTGKPKNTDDLKRTVYLRISNNKVSDIVRVETKDHVTVDVKISLLVNFEGDDPELWFQAENYVKLLCDHVRSVLKGTVQKISIEDFYANHVAVVRDAILGESVETEKEGLRLRSRTGMSFEENGMAVRDVEVLNFDIQNREVAELLGSAQLDAVRNNIEIQQAQKQLQRDLRQEEINQSTADARTGTQLHGLDLETKVVAQTLETNLARLDAETKKAAQQKVVQVAVEESNHVIHEWKQKREQEIHEQKNVIDTKKQDLFLKQLKAEVDSAVKRFEAGKSGLAEALLALNRDDVMMKVAEAMSVQSMIGGKSFVEVVQKVFEGMPPLADIATRVAMLHSNDGDQD